jgi:thiol-disulfide isomerase/thioredoxin
MSLEHKSKRNIWNKLGNLAFIVALVLLFFNSNAKAWLLRQMMWTGLFNAELNKEAVVASGHTTFGFMTADGKLSSTADLEGKVVFVNFWATWCPPCIAEMPSLNALYEKLKNEPGIVFLFVNEDNDYSKAAAYLKRKGFSLPVVRQHGQVPKEIFSGTLPTTVVLNKNGQIVLKEEGLANYNTAEFLSQLKAMQ